MKRLSHRQIFLLLTILIGVLAALSAVLFTLAIEAASHLLLGIAPSPLRTILIPVVVSLLTGILLWKYFPDSRGSGVPQTEAAYHLHKGQIPGSVPVSKFFLGALTIGAGHSMGREGPSVQIGAGIASALGRWFGLPPAVARNLIPVGAAAALSAAFNTPVAAVLFALEEIVGDMNASIIGSTVLASVSAVVVERALLGNEVLFRVPAYQLVHPAELLAYAVLGVAGGFISLVFTEGLLWSRAMFRKLPAWSVPLRPALGGLAIGVMLVYFPQVKSVGYEYVDQALNGGLPLKIMLILCAAKLVATIVSYSSGNAGGIFAPSLYMGAMAGGAMGILVRHIAPFPTSDPGAFALVGMGTLFAGIIRAPMTSVFMIFELTQDYQILVPLMIANMISYGIARRLRPVPVYHALLKQDGVDLSLKSAS
jgi:CIC family chloride channel protein